MTLTEQWKKGELEKGYYYIKLPTGRMEIVSHDSYKYIENEEIKRNLEVLAPVPSYEELEELKIDNHNLKAWIKHFQPKYKEMEKENAQLRKWCEEFNALDVAKENQQLKILLKEWMHFYPIILYEHEDTLKTKDIVELFDKTREVLK